MKGVDYKASRYVISSIPLNKTWPSVDVNWTQTALCFVARSSAPLSPTSCNARGLKRALSQGHPQIHANPRLPLHSLHLPERKKKRNLFLSCTA